MKDVLLKLNNIKTHNQIVRLKRENDLKDKKMKDFAEECKGIIAKYKENSEEIIESMNEKINKLENEKIELEKQNSYYKDVINKIPKFILKLFTPKKNLLYKGE